MKKLVFVIAGLAAVAPANAETTVIKKDGGPRAEMRMHSDHGWHRDHHKTVIIKHGHHHD